MAAVEEAYRGAGLTPPDLATLAARAGVAVGVAETATAYLLRQKMLVKLDTLVLHREVLEGLKRDVAAMKAAAPAWSSWTWRCSRTATA